MQSSPTQAELSQFHIKTIQGVDVDMNSADPRKEKRVPRRKIDLMGKRFGRLVVIADIPGKWLCQCDCGNQISATGTNLRIGDIVSCGCRKKDGFEHATKHGKRNSRLYVIWQGMIRRCGNKNSDQYVRYGARGISVCDRWKNFENFLADMGEPPEGATIDRINNDGNYEPGNCRWASTKEQGRNKRTNRVFEIDGVSKALVEWCELYKVNYFAAHGKISRGKSIKQALGNE